MEKKVLKYITNIEVVIYLALMVILMVILIFSTLELAYLIIDALFFDDTMLKLETKGILASFEFFLLILIGLELMETIKSFLETRKIQVEIVIILAIIAVARKIIIIDPKTISNDILLGIGVVIFALTAGYFFIKKADSLTPERAAEPKKE
ncbi:phosphate-starvation-inducible PsiE family protein [Methanolacinia petrolearia]|uniref:phosphate-starvation-inducible PsiE family protein n=1 Tax=Methanolacinia petrolearia TaxID=54120 RepID=UPI003BABE245